MLPGPSYIYACTNCGNLIKKGSLMSGNTFNSKLYSDGKRVSPMLPEFPDLTKCANCKTILWLSRQEEIGKMRMGDVGNQNWVNADNAQFLSIDDYFVALDTNAQNSRDVAIIRKKIWWAYNDRVRDEKKLVDNALDENRWRVNCIELSNLLDPAELNQQVMLAELKRNLGDFKGCIDIIEQIQGEEFDWLKDKFVAACEEQNTLVFRLK
jgi:hypothetical protein